MSVDHPLMLCGHAAQGFTVSGNPVCVICFGIVPGADEINPSPADLSARTAKCNYCDHARPSSTDLAFFEYLPKQPTDAFYCGCRGWD